MMACPSMISWPRTLVQSQGGGGPGQKPEDVLGRPNGVTYTLQRGLSATFGDFYGALFGDLAELLTSPGHLGDNVTASHVARTDVLAFERNDNGPAPGQGWESCDFTFSGGAQTVSVGWDERAGAARDSHVVANGSIHAAEYLSYFKIPSSAPRPPLASTAVISFLMFSLPELTTNQPKFTVRVSGSSIPEGTPDIDAIGVLPRRA